MIVRSLRRLNQAACPARVNTATLMAEGPIRLVRTSKRPVYGLPYARQLAAREPRAGYALACARLCPCSLNLRINVYSMRCDRQGGSCPAIRAQETRFGQSFRMLPLSGIVFWRCRGHPPCGTARQCPFGRHCDPPPTRLPARGSRPALPCAGPRPDASGRAVPFPPC